MAKIKINKLPKGFELVDGKIKEVKSMADGGYVTGDQADYGLVTTPQNYYGDTTFNNTSDESVRYSLSSVPRENANIEAEGGETVLTDLNDDGNFGLYGITGPRHSQGGVPMFLPEQSFIYSDTPKLKFGREEMSEFDMTGNKRVTPAKISKRFGLNDYYAELDSEYADNISSRSAELMLKKNMEDLSKLAFMQESKKSFEDGVPLASHPYLMSIGIDPLQFTAQMEQISMEEAQQKAIEALSPVEQQQLQYLQMMVQQAQQEQQDPQGNMAQNQQMAMQQNAQPIDEFDLAGANNAMMQTARFGSELTDFMRKAQEGEEKTNPNFKNPYPKGTKEHAQLEKYNDEKYIITEQDGKIRIYKPGTSKFDVQGETVIGDYETVGTGEDIDIYSEDVEGQGQVLAESGIGRYRKGMFANKRPPKQGSVYNNQIKDGVYDPDIKPDRSSGVYAYGSSSIKSPEAQKDFELRWGDVTSTIEGFDYSKPANDPQWLEFQNKAEAKRKEEAKAQNIPYVPYFKKKGSKGYKPGEAWDGKLGLHTFNTPRLDVDYTAEEEIFMDLPEKSLDVPEDKPIKEPPGVPKRWWAQDENNLMTLAALDDTLRLPFGVPLERQDIDYVLDDYTGAVGANNAALNTMADALTAAGGPQALLRSDVFGKTLDANAKAINKVNQNNVKTMNRVATMQPQLDMTVDRLNNAINQGVYDNTQLALENYEKNANARKIKANELFNTGATNAANTYNLNQMYDTFNTDASKYGDIEFTPDGRRLVKTSQADNTQAYFDALVEYDNNTPGEGVSKEIQNSLFKAYGLGTIDPNDDRTRGQADLDQIDLQDIGYSMNNAPGKRGKELKRGKLPKWAMPFYTGKMGM